MQCLLSESPASQLPIAATVERSGREVVVHVKNHLQGEAIEKQIFQIQSEGEGVRPVTARMAVTKIRKAIMEITKIKFI